MKKRRFGLSSKIILFTGGLTILTVATSLTVNLLISYQNKKDDFISSCADATNVIENTFTASNDENEKIRNIISIILDNYGLVRTKYDTMTPEEIKTYQEQTCIDLFGPLDGSMGMTYEKSLRRGFYMESLFNMQSACNTYDVPFSSFFIFDYDFDRSIMIAVSNVSLENNFTIIGSVSEITNKKELEFLYSRKNEKVISETNFVYAYNFIDNLTNYTNYSCIVLAEYPLVEFNNSFKNQLITELSISLGSSVFLVILYALFARFFLIKNVKTLTTSTESFIEKMKNNEELEIVDNNIKSHDEIRDLSDSFLTMQKQIIDYIEKIKTAKDKEHQLNTEISIASKIQLESLPGVLYYDRNAEIRALIKPAKAVGGDFYDYFYIDKDHIALIIADVSGKGIPASLFMMRAKESLKSASASGRKLSDVLFNVNNALVTNNIENYFVTAFLGILDLKTYKFEYINAGHERPFIKHGGKVEQLQVKPNFVLGLEEDYVFEQESIQLEEGDEIFLHTDGLNEAINPKKEEFGYQRIEEVLSRKNTLNGKIKDVIAELDAFRGEEEQFDDITILAVKIREGVFNLEIKNPDYNSIPTTTDTICDYLSDADFEILAKIGVIIDEVMNNIISYGKSKTNKRIEIQVEKEGDDIILIFIDNSHPFNPLNKKSTTVQENLDAGIVGGLGISIVRSISKETEYNYTVNKNILVVKM